MGNTQGRVVHNENEIEHKQSVVENYQDIHALKLRADDKLKREDYTGAIVDYTEVLRLEPANENILLSRSDAYYYLEMYKEAIDDCTIIIQTQEKPRSALIKRAWINSVLGNHHAAIIDYNDFITITTNLTYAFNNRAILFRIVGQFKKADIDIAKARYYETNPPQIELIKSVSQGWKYILCATKEIQKGNFAAALHYCNEQIRIHPDDIEAYRCRAKVYNHLLLFDKARADKIEIARYNMLRPLPHFVVESFIQGLRTKLEDYYVASKTLNSGLIKRNINLTEEEVETDHLKHVLHKTEKGIKILSGVLLLSSFFLPHAIAGSILFHTIQEMLHKIDEKGEAIPIIVEALIPEAIELLHQFKRQHSLKPDNLMKHFRRSFNNAYFETFIGYATQYFVWRYANQVNLFHLNNAEAERFGDKLGERISEPFMLGLCTWSSDPDFNKILQTVSHWVYYAADLPFLLKRLEPSPTFVTSDEGVLNLNELLSPDGFEMLDENNQPLLIDIDPVERLLDDFGLDAHTGNKKMMPNRSNSLVTYCRATTQEIEQLKLQAKTKWGVENKSNSGEKIANLQALTPQSSVKSVARPTFFSQSGLLPFVIKAGATDKINDEIKQVTLEYKDSTEMALRKELANHKKEKDAQIAALIEENRKLREEAEKRFAVLEARYDNTNQVTVDANYSARQPSPR